MGSPTDTITGRSTASSSSSSSTAVAVAVAAAAGTVVGIGIGMVASRYFFGPRIFSPPLASRPAYKPGQTPPPPSPSFGKKIHTFDPNQLTSAYHLMISTVTPRPIALVSSTAGGGGGGGGSVDNVAPFSYFGCVGHDPPMLAIGFCRNRNGTMKDSIQNILESKQFAVQIISEWYLDAANHTCGAFSPETDEFVASGLTKKKKAAPANTNTNTNTTTTTTTTTAIDPGIPQVAQAGVVYECRLVHVHPMTNPQSGKPTTEIILAQVVRIHVDETLLVEQFDPLQPQVDTTKLKPLGRLGGNLYTTLGDIVDIPRPQV